MIPVDVHERLRSIVGQRHVQADREVLAPRGIDWLGRPAVAPALLVTPGDGDEIAAVLETCDEHRVPVVAQGGRSSLVASSVPHCQGTVVLSTDRLRGIDTSDVDAGIVTVGAGVTLAELDAALASTGWRYPIDFGARDVATIGGTVATNAGGIGAFRHGMTRQRVRGLDVALPSGARQVHTGAPLKDNVGYSLDSLICGSEGTLGIVVAATLSLAPRPAHRAAALVGCATVTEAIALARRYRREGVGLEAVEYLSAACVASTTSAFGDPVGFESAHYLLVEMGDNDDPSDRLSELVGQCSPDAPNSFAVSAAAREALWIHRDRIGELLRRHAPILKFDLSLPGDGFAALVEESSDLVRSGTPWCFGHACDQNLHLNVTGFDIADGPLIEAAVYQRVAELGGSIAAEHGIGHTKREWLSVARSASEIATMRSLKAALDPHGTLNPGVLFPCTGGEEQPGD